MEIRPVEPAEHEALGRLTVEAYRRVVGSDLDYYEAELADVATRAAEAVVLAAVEQGRLLGGVTYVPGPGNPYAEFDEPDAAGIRMLAVSSEASGRGVGRALVLACLDRARTDGRARVILHSTKEMVIAQRIYRRLGFERTPSYDLVFDGLHLPAFARAVDAPGLAVRSHDDPRRFMRLAGPLLRAREAENTVLLGAASRLIEGAGDGERAGALLLTVEHGGQVVAAALRAPPWPLALSCGAPAAALEALAADVATRFDDLHVVGIVPDVEHFAAAWTARRAGSAAPAMRLRLLACERAVPPARPAPGRSRAAAWEERSLLGGWADAFAAEALPHEQHDRTGVERVEALLAGGGSGVEVWEDGGRPVSMAVQITPAGSVPRLGLVYTPPEARGRGYATSCVAALTSRLLAAGHARVLLYTDLANPTSNALYQAIGFRHVADFAQLALRRRDRRPLSQGGMLTS